MSNQRTDQQAVASVFEPDLQDGERVVWSAQPHMVYPIKYYFMWLVGIGFVSAGLWYLFCTIMCAIALLSGRNPLDGLGAAMCAVPAAFLLYLGVWKLIVPLSSLPVLMRNTYYAITDRRVIRLSIYKGRTIEAVSIADGHALPRLTKPYADETLGDLRVDGSFCLVGVEDVDHVFDILLELLPEDMRSVPEARRRSYESRQRKDDARLRRWEKGLPSVATDVNDLVLPPPVTGFGKGHAGFAKTPRPVRASTVLTLLFGSFTTQVGWIFLIFFAFGFWSVKPWIYVPSPMYWLRTTTVPGEIMTVRDTGEGAGERPILAYTYRYTAHGVDRTGTWYSTERAYRPGVSADIVVTVRPISLSMIDGLPSPRPDAGVLVFGLLHMLILRAMAHAIWRALRSARLLAIGKPARGVVIDLSFISPARRSAQKPETCTTTLVHEVDGKRYRGTTRIFCRRRIKLEDTVFLLYAPAHPERVVVPDFATALGIETDRDGAIAVPEMPLGRSLKYAAIPLISIVVNVLCAYYMLIG